jgi:hypothetical protein
MKNIIINTLLILLLFQSVLLSQTGEHITCYVFPEAASSPLGIQSDCFNYNTHYEDAPIITVYVNVHIFNSSPSVNTATLVQRAKDFIRFSNETFADMQQNWRNAPNGMPAPRVPDAKIRVKLYSESTNTNDIYGGIWVYPTQVYPSSTRLRNIPNNPPYIKRYGSNVIDVVLINRGFNPQATGVNNGGVTTIRTSNNSNWIYIEDVNAAFEKDIMENNGINNWSRAISRSFNHEIGHVLSLLHSEDCDNPCGGKDIDVQEECGPNCPQKYPCALMNPGMVDCNGILVNRCTWANSRNMTSQGWWNDAITPCQWEGVFNYTLNNARNFLRLCATATTLNLTTSPLDDYRASQSIVSTSIITGSRKVDYFAPSIKMNNGFRVAQGTGFLAYPSSFTCCSVGGVQLQADNNNLSDILESTLNKQAILYPNPFDQELNLNASFLEIGSFDETANINIFDSNGESVYSGSISGSNNTKLNTSAWESGVYYLLIQTSIKTVSRKLVKIE